MTYSKSLIGMQFFSKKEAQNFLKGELGRSKLKIEKDRVPDFIKRSGRKIKTTYSIQKR